MRKPSMFAYLHSFIHMTVKHLKIYLFSIALHQNIAIDDLAINVETFVTFHSAVTEL